MNWVHVTSQKQSSLATVCCNCKIHWTVNMLTFQEEARNLIACQICYRNNKFSASSLQCIHIWWGSMSKQLLCNQILKCTREINCAFFYLFAHHQQQSMVTRRRQRQVTFFLLSSRWTSECALGSLDRVWQSFWSECCSCCLMWSGKQTLALFSGGRVWGGASMGSCSTSGHQTLWHLLDWLVEGLGTGPRTGNWCLFPGPHSRTRSRQTLGRWPPRFWKSLNSRLLCRDS